MTNQAQNQPSDTQQNSSPKLTETQQSPTNIHHSTLAQQILQSQLVSQKQLHNPSLANANILGLHNFVNMPMDTTSQQIQAQLFQSLMGQSLMQTSHLTQASDEHQLYEYIHQLNDEKERLKDLTNEPFNFALPICSKLLDEGNFFSNEFLAIVAYLSRRTRKSTMKIAKNNSSLNN